MHCVFAAAARNSEQLSDHMAQHTTASLATLAHNHAQALYSLVKRSFVASAEPTSGGEAGGGGQQQLAVKGLGVSVNNVVMELRSICSYACIRWGALVAGWRGGVVGP